MRAAIVGAGLVGRILAWRLCELGANITLLDAQARDYKGTGLVAAAMIAPGTEVVTAEPLVERIGRRSMALWKPWLDQLSTATGWPVNFNRTGTLVVAHAQDEGDWQRFMQHAEAKLNKDAFHYLDYPQLQKQAPELSRSFAKAGFFPDEAVLDNEQLYSTLAHYFDQKSIVWHENTSIDSLTESGRLDGFKQPFDWVFDCRGNGARLAQPTLRSVRGEVIRVYAPEVNIRQAVRLMHPRYPLYIAPRQNNLYVIGATQIESEHDTPVTVRSGLELLSALYSVHKGFAEAQIRSLDVACRPAYEDNLPRLQKTSKLIQINGLYRHGYLFAPALVDDAIALMRSESMQFPEVLYP